MPDHPPAQRASLGEEIGHPEIVEGDDDGRAIRAAGEEIDGRMHPIGSSLVLNVEHVQAKPLCNV